MIEDAPKNKMDISTSKRKQNDAPEKVTVRAVSVIKNEYHFPGSGKWHPLSVVATTLEEAEGIWKQRRKPVVTEQKNAGQDTSKEQPETSKEDATSSDKDTPEETSNPETKVEEPKETNNQ